MSGIWPVRLLHANGGKMRRYARLLLVCLASMLIPDSTADARPPSRGASQAKQKSKVKAKRRSALQAKRHWRSRVGVETRATSGGAARPAILPILDVPIVCPPDMVAVAGRVCVDRYEIALVDVAQGAQWPHHYAPDGERAARAFRFYQAMSGTSPAVYGSLPVPTFPGPPGSLKAISDKGRLPQGYMNRGELEAACHRADKRLCSEAEWVTACMGDMKREFPYGQRYVQDECNVVRETHPSVELHGTAARYHDDPRNHLVQAGGRTLLLPTGTLPRCASRWGNDAIYDMVGNLDEWVADGSGVFVGGFFSRGTRAGCFARISSHVASYSDYSTGGRCCKTP